MVKEANLRAIGANLVSGLHKADVGSQRKIFESADETEHDNKVLIWVKAFTAFIAQNVENVVCLFIAK
ncbi:hypothetical protein D6089_20480 [Vibrio vulnificus]|nr:hypothetical protein [Vibrio vulnificus]